MAQTHLMLQPRIADLGIDVPAWIKDGITNYDVASINEGGCASGAYMPAVTYHEALETMNEHGVVPLKGDWTNHNENITSWLSCYGRAGVPYYVVLPADPSQPAIPLGEAVTTGSIIEAIEKASAKGGATQEG